MGGASPNPSHDNSALNLARWGFPAAQSGQVTTAASNFGEVAISHFKMLSSKEILVFNPPQLSDRWTTTRRPARPRIAQQVRTWVRTVAGSRYHPNPAAR